MSKQTNYIQHNLLQPKIAHHKYDISERSKQLNISCKRELKRIIFELKRGQSNRFSMEILSTFFHSKDEGELQSYIYQVL